MKKATVLLVLFCASAIFSQVQRKANCATNIFDKERIELSHQQKLNKITNKENSENVVGDTLDFWVFKHPWANIKAVCKAVGENSYIFVETGMWDAGFVDSMDVINVYNSFENQTLNDMTKGIYETNIENFGAPPNSLDGDHRIYILFFDMGAYGDGSFFAFNQYTQATIDSFYGPGLYYSNEKEILNMNARNDVSSNLMLSVVAHEFEHMIHWNWDPDEVSWIDEGCAEYSMYLYGYPDPIVLFNMYPDNDLTMWDSGFADYIQSYLFMMYLYEQYGGQNAIKTVVEEERNSIDGVNHSLLTLGSEDSFNDVFSNWVIANYIDDTVAYSGKYGYSTVELPQFETSRSHSTYPIEQVSRSVSPWAANYIWMNNGSAQNFHFDGDDNGIFHVSVIKIDTASNIIVDEITIDSEQNGDYDMSDFDDRWTQIIFVISNQKSSGIGNYSYSTSLITDVENKTDLPKSYSLSQNYPNPFNPSTVIKYSIPKKSMVTLKVFDALGREVTALIKKEQTQGHYELEFDSKNLTSGIYFYRITAGNPESSAGQVFVETKKMLLVK
jgi:Secretion system C-terminal sorting domain